MQPAAVHYMPEEGRWKKDEVTGKVFPVQNVPLPLKRPAEFNDGIWGGEAVIKGSEYYNIIIVKYVRFILK